MTDADKRQAILSILKNASDRSMSLDHAITCAIETLSTEDGTINETIGWLSGADEEAKRIAAMLETVNILHTTRQKKD